MSREFLSGKILNSHWKVLDGLRAWAVVLLMFARASDRGCTPAIVTLKGDNDDLVIDFCRRLMNLQEARNPAAHRQTLIQISDIETIRKEVFHLFRDIDRMI